MARVTTSNYRSLAAFRYEIRRFLAFCERAARAAGVEPQQHQLLLAVCGMPEGLRPTIGAVAERLCVRHHTTVALIRTASLTPLASRAFGSSVVR